MNPHPKQDMENLPKVSAHTQDPTSDGSMPQPDHPVMRGSTTESVRDDAKPYSNSFDTKRFDNLDAMMKGLITAELKDL
jgi:hypothetical protein